MTDDESPVSTRKRIKLQHGIDGAMDDINGPVTEKAFNDPPLSPARIASQLDKEAQCGITEFIRSDRQAFAGILKKRYTDFLVNEILPSGLVVHLDDFRAPRAKKTDATSTFLAKVKPTENATSKPRSTNDSETAFPEPEPVTRTKHTVFVKETDEGIEEISKNESSGLTVVKVPQQGNAAKFGNTAEAGDTAKLGNAVTGAEAENTQLMTEPERQAQTSTTSDWNAYAGKSARFELPFEDRETMKAYFSTKVIEDILALYNRVLHTPNRKAKEHGTVKSPAIPDRMLRTKIHQDLRRIFQSRLESMTNNDGAMVICAMAGKPQWGSRQPNGDKPARKSEPNRRFQWKEFGGEYLHFTLYKENKDTMEAIAWLSRQLNVPAKSFQFAGTKDRRGVTVQRISVRRVAVDTLIAAGRTLRQAKIGNYQYQPFELRLGDLKGNEFAITLRNCTLQSKEDASFTEKFDQIPSIVEESVNSLQRNGYINYYGLQRFGSFSTRTDIIGVKMLQGDLKAAVDAILDFNPALLKAALVPSSQHDKYSTEDKARAYAIQQFNETGKSHSALENLPKKFSAESSIIRHLSTDNLNSDYQGALCKIPRNLRLMYVHAYQSLVWNVMAGIRWKEYGSSVVEGDLVLVREHPENADIRANPAAVDADGELAVEPDDEDCATNADDVFERARALSKEEAASRRYTIFDIVLPTPGYDILYPANTMAEHYKYFMASERGGGLDPHDMRRSWKDTSLSGSYRKLLARPMGKVTFEVKSYTGDNEQFAETDLDKFAKEGKYNERYQYQAPVSTNDGEKAVAPLVVEEKKVAVLLRLQLGSSQYATMALRELMGPGGLQTYKPDYGGGR